MKINHQNQRTRNLIIVTAIVTIAAMAAGVFAWQAGYFESEDRRPKTTDVTNENYQPSADDISPENNKDTSSDLPAKNQPSPSLQTTEPTNSSELKIDGSISTPTIERAGQSGDNIKVVAGFASAQSGVCQATFTRQGQPALVYTSDITVSPSNYTCVFVVPVSSFTISGDWNLSLVNRINERASKAAAANIEVSR